MKRAPGQPFVENQPPFGQIYHVGDGDDMVRLLEQRARPGLDLACPDQGLELDSRHFPRPERSTCPTRWLGAAWKAMPADLSLDQLGTRALDLLDDMANWGQKKYLPGEVDVFKIDHTHELYGHMNINYIRLEPDRLPRFDEGWQPVLDALRSGRFFVTTGEVLIPEFTGRRPAEWVDRRPEAGESVEVQFQLNGRFRSDSPSSSRATAVTSFETGSTLRKRARSVNKESAAALDLSGAEMGSPSRPGTSPTNGALPSRFGLSRASRLGSSLDTVDHAEGLFGLPSIDVSAPARRSQ